MSATHGRRLTTTTARTGSGPWQPRRLSSWTWPTAARPLWNCPGATPVGWPHSTTRLQGTDGVELCGHLRRVHADTVCVVVTAFAAGATGRAASRAGVRQVLSRPVGFGRLIPLLEGVAGTP